MASETEQRFILKALHEAGDSLISEFYGLAEVELGWRPAEDEWSLREIAAHLRHAEELAHAQFQAILSGNPRQLPAWDIDSRARERDCQGGDVFALLRAFARRRRQTSYLLWGLFAHDWQRCGHHPYRGPVSVQQIAKELVEHNLGHLWQVRRLKEQLREQAAPRATDD